MILNIITIIVLTLAILFLIVLIVKPIENFSFFKVDKVLKEKVDIKNNENRNLNIQNNIEENKIKQRKTIDQISKEIDKFDNILTFIKQNIHNIPVCREIDLRHDIKPVCSTRPLASCSLNNFCLLKDDKCINKELNPECADVLELDSEGKRTGKAKQMFVYPSVLEEIK
jgi:hypothetical protein